MKFFKRFIHNFIVHGVYVFILGGFFWLCATGYFLRWHYQNEENRRAMLQIRENINVGDSLATAYLNYSKYKSEELELSQRGKECWIIRMPFEIGAIDWQLYLGFKNESVTTVLVRTSDGPKPKDAPEDIGDGKICGFNK